MRKIVYYVAISIDGYICGPGADISGFVAQGSGLDQYLADLKTYDTVIMGRNTYEFGYQYGLKPGHKAYDHMEHYIFSNTLAFEDAQEGVHVCQMDPAMISKIKEKEGTDIYLCGGGQFAGWLLDLKLIEEVKIKLNPFIQGDGVKLFENSKGIVRLTLNDSGTYDDGLQIMSYSVQY